MKPSKQMQAWVTALAHHHGLDLHRKGAHLRLEKPGEFPLVVEVIDADRISVGQYFETQHAIWIPVLEVLIFTGAEEWVPLETVAMVRQIYAFTTSKGLGWYVDAGHIVTFVERWAEELAAGGWLAQASAAVVTNEEAADASGDGDG